MRHPSDVLIEAKMISDQYGGRWEEPDPLHPLMVKFYSKTGLEIEKFSFASELSLSDAEAKTFLARIRKHSGK